MSSGFPASFHFCSSDGLQLPLYALFRKAQHLPGYNTWGRRGFLVSLLGFVFILRLFPIFTSQVPSAVSERAVRYFEPRAEVTAFLPGLWACLSFR